MYGRFQTLNNTYVTDTYVIKRWESNICGVNTYANKTKQYHLHIILMIKVICLITALIYAPEIEFEN